MKANHNRHSERLCPCSAVFNMSKIQIWKRITTETGNARKGTRLYLICQRYKFESESQPDADLCDKANAVFNMSKIQIWKRITTTDIIEPISAELYLICQRYKFESESQLLRVWILLRPAVFNMSKVQIWKRITTACSCVSNTIGLYLICQRYKFESESQLPPASSSESRRCI